MINKIDKFKKRKEKINRSEAAAKKKKRQNEN